MGMRPARAPAIEVRVPPVTRICLALGLLTATLASLAAPVPARACSVCGCGDPLLTSSDPAAITGQLRLQLDVEYLQVSSGNEVDPALTDRLSQWSYRLNTVYRPVEALSFSATLPVVSKELRTVGGGPPAAPSNATGLGDVEVGARWAAWRRVVLGLGRVQELALTAGTSMPTGPNGERAGGERIDEHGQPGTGAWSPFAGVAYRFEQRSWLMFASLSGRLHSQNGYGYTYGSALLWSVHGQYFPSGRFAFDLGVDGRYAAADRDPGGAVVNTGGTVLAVSPGVYFQASGPAWLFVRGQLPFYVRFQGDQSQLPSFVSGVQYLVR